MLALSQSRREERRDVRAARTKDVAPLGSFESPIRVGHTLRSLTVSSRADSQKDVLHKAHSYDSLWKGRSGKEHRVVANRLLARLAGLSGTRFASIVIR